MSKWVDLSRRRIIRTLEVAWTVMLDVFVSQGQSVFRDTGAGQVVGCFSTNLAVSILFRIAHFSLFTR